MIDPCIQGWIAHTKWILFEPVEASTDSCWVISVPGLFPVYQESPLAFLLPSVSHPGCPASAGFSVGGPLPFAPCHLAIALQM